MERKLLVPVRTTTAGTLALRFGRLPSGERTGLAFTSEASLARTMGPSQEWTDLARTALLDMLAPLGIEQISVDPDLSSGPRADSAPQHLRPLPGQPEADAAAYVAANDPPARRSLAWPAALPG